MPLRSSAVLAAALALAALASPGCKPSQSGGTSLRLTPVEAFTDAGLEGAKLVDRDTTTGLRIERPIRLHLRFHRPIVSARVAIHGDPALRVTAPGLDPLVPEGEGGWRAGTLDNGGKDGIVLELAPGSAPASIDEVEVWAPGEHRVETDLSALAEVTRPLELGPRDPPPRNPPPADRWVADDVRVVDGTPAAATLSPRGAGAEGADCATASIGAGVAVRAARRAYLVYEANVQRPVVLQRSLDADPPAGGFWLTPTEQAATQIDELDPARLTGQDQVLLCLPPEATGPVTIRQLRLVLLLDGGRDGFDRDAERLLGAATDGDASTSAALAGRVEAGLDHGVVVNDAGIRLASGPARLHALASFDGTAWSEQGDVALPAGPSALPLDGRVARALALTIEGTATANVAELAVAGRAAGPRAGAARIVVTYPRLKIQSGQLVGERFGGRAFVAGWAESPAGAGTVEIDGASVGIGGAFAVPLQRPIDATDGWTVTVRARFPDGREAVTAIHLDDDHASEIATQPDPAATAAEDARFGAEDATSWSSLGTAGGKVSLGSEVELEAPAGAVLADTRIGIARKGYEVMPPLDAGMVNVSAPAHFAYRFLPKGQKFAKPVKVKVPYDPALLPEGMLPQEIQTYYYDETEKRWLTLARAEVDTLRHRIVSETDHFTFMINAVLVMPEHPGPASFDPNSIKDLKAADPSSGIDLVEPPSGSTQGTASVSFPVRLPGGRGAYQPSLGLVYDSGGASGWVGVGWDLPVSSVSIDTRYGVPVYDGEERYALDGAQLVPISAEARCADGSSGRVYMARVERDFRRIVRCGADTTRFWFEVTDKGGTLFVYGHDENARLRSYVPHLTAIPQYPPTFDIGQWFVERVVDANGNLTRFVYQHDSRDEATGAFGEDFRQVYLSDVHYTGRADRATGAVLSDGPYHVRLDHLAPGGTLVRRQDLVTSGRLGFKTLTRRLLGTIRVDLKQDQIRQYVLEYEEGDFGKTRLRSVVANGRDGSRFYQHAFEYTSRVAEAALPGGRVAAFAGPYPWAVQGDKDALTASHDEGAGVHFFGGVGLDASKGGGTIGFAIDYNQRKSETDASFVDVNGDGLPDRLRTEGARLNRPRTLDRDGALTPGPRPGDPPAPGTGPAFAIPTGSSLGKDTSHTISGALQVMGYTASGNFGGSFSFTESKDLVVDANGDGLPDLLSNGEVLYNQPRCAGPAFSCFQPGMPAPALQQPEFPFPQLASDPTVAAANTAAKDALSPEDVVLEWNAPRAGYVDVSGTLQFANAVLTGGRHDGVRLRIYRWYEQIAEYEKFPDDAAPTPVAQRLLLEPGDVLYFVLSTLRDFPVGQTVELPGQKSHPYSPEEVGFSPVIAYPFVDEHLRELVDPTGREVFRFDAADDFRLAGEPQIAITVPRDGRIRLTSLLQKYPSADDVLVCAQYYEPGEYPKTKRTCAPNDPAHTPIYLPLGSRNDSSPSIPVLERTVKGGGTFVFTVTSAMAIDPATVQWRISGEMTCLDGDAGCVEPPEKLKPSLHFAAVPYHRLHVPVHHRLARNLPDWYQPDPDVLVPFQSPVAGKLAFEVRTRVGGDMVQDLLKQQFPVTFAVRSPNGVRLKWLNDVPVFAGAVVDVDANVPLFFEGHGELDLDVHFDVRKARFQPAGSDDWFDVDIHTGFTTCRATGDFDLGNVPLLSGGFHGWRYGVWQGQPDEAFTPWVFRTTPDDKDRWDHDPDTLRRTRKDEMKDPNDPDRKRIRLMSLLVPRADGTSNGSGQEGLKPGVPAWTTQDGNAFVIAGGMNAGRRGSTVNRPDGQAATIPASFGMGDMGRKSIAVTVTGGVSVGPASLAMSAGMSQQKQDVLDLNGDGIPDVVVSGGLPDVSALAGGDLAGFLAGGSGAQVRITNPASLTPRNTVDIPVHPRLNVDVGGQAGLGITEAVKLLLAKLKVSAVVGRMPDLSLGGGVGVNVATTVQDLVDVNGDGLPDAVRKVDGCRGFAVRLNLGNTFARGEDCVETVAFGADVLTGFGGQLDPTGAQNPVDDGDTTRSIGLGGEMAGAARDPGAIRQTSTVSIQSNAGGGGSVDEYEQFGFSVTTESSLAATNVALVDVTGDGLPDFVARANGGGDFVVMVNTGYGFLPPRRWAAPAWPSGAKPRFHVSSAGVLTGVGAVVEAFAANISDGIDPVEATGTHGNLPTTGFVFTISIPIPPAMKPWLHFSFGENVTLGRTTGFEMGMQDIDGDGLADQVLKTSDRDVVYARVNRLAGGNLLRRVTRPLGGSFDVEYARAGNTVDMPGNRWVLSKVTVHDGVAPGTGHDIATRYEYDGGKYDRNEREFLGFATVSRTHADETRVVQTFLNGDFRYKGLLEREVVLDARGRTFVETVNGYGPPEVRSGAPVTGCVARTPLNVKYPEDLYCAASFVPLTAVQKNVYEGEEHPGVSSRQRFHYDAFGNVDAFWDDGDLADADDDIQATVQYGPPEGAAFYCVAAPTDIRATDGQGRTLRHRFAKYESRCNLTELHSLVDGTTYSVSTLEYWNEGKPYDGNLKKVTSPPNHRDQRYYVDYDYDGVIGAHVVWTHDAHDYVSTAKYDPYFGENVFTTDVNGQETSREFDVFGRLRKVAAPGFTLASPTIDITYASDTTATYRWALTKNALPEGGTLDTAVLVDGLKRVVQTKKTAEVWAGTGDNTKVGWAVTGHVAFDVMGRVEQQGQTFFQPGSAPDYVAGAPRNPTRLTHDVLGRTIQTLEPDGAQTRIAIAFGMPADTTITRLRTTAIDALGKIRVVYKSAGDRTVAVEEHVEGRTPTTRYGYDPLGQLVSVTDAAGNLTASKYDLLGRRTELDNPDEGRTAFHFDLAGNLFWKEDANLRKQGGAITYVYDYERLAEVHYPDARRDVIYTYGATGADEHAAGRITTVADELGTEARGYDLLGNLARSTRTIVPLRPGDRERSFTTTFRFDVFGRMLSMVYPDLEELKYGYDRGGLLKSARGERAATAHEVAQFETYLQTLQYDEFGQRVHLRVGNGVETTYAYEPLTRRLASLHTQKPGERLLQNLFYKYDLVGNVLELKNALGEPVPPHAGDVTFTYAYDDLHRLTYAHGEARSRPTTTDTFTSTFAYSDIHNMRSNVQVHHVLHGPTGGGEYPPHTNQALDYTYGGTGPHQATRIGDTSLVYDDNGNTLRECRDPAAPTCTAQPSHLRRFLWTEENRLDAVIDGGGRNITKFYYDADGQRVAKLGRGGESITIGQFWALKGRRAATKHVFAGATRIASKLLPPPGWDDVPRGGTVTAATTTDLSGCEPSNYQPQKCQVLPGGEPVLNDYYADTKVRPETYYYHPDHLGSTSWVTDQNARVHEHVEYFPYGAVWRDPRSDVGASPVKGQRFLFTGKELDEETGLYYFGARYYDPRTALWKSADPALGEFLESDRGLGAIRNPKNGGLYGYAHHNPIRLTDPNGESATLIGAVVGGAVGAGIALWRGEDARHVLGAAAQGAIAGAIAGSVIDTGGASLGVLALAGGGGNVVGGVAGRLISGDKITAGTVALDAAVGAGGAVAGALAGKALTVGIQRLVGPSRAFGTLRPGPFARNPVAATGPRVTAAQSRAVTANGICHTCGTQTAGRASGVFTGDHQPATGLIVREAEQLLFSHCVGCQGKQAWEVVMQNTIWRAQQEGGRAAGAAATMSAGNAAAQDHPASE